MPTLKDAVGNEHEVPESALALASDDQEGDDDGEGR